MYLGFVTAFVPPMYSIRQSETPLQFATRGEIIREATTYRGDNNNNIGGQRSEWSSGVPMLSEPDTDLSPRIIRYTINPTSDELQQRLTS